MGSHQIRLFLVLPPLLFLLMMSVLPLLRLLQEGGVPSSIGLLNDPYLRWRLLWSVLQGAVTCVLAFFLGVPAAWALARFRFVGRSLILRLLMLPFVMPTLVAGVGVLALFGPQGVSGLNFQDSPWLLLYGNLFFNLPLVIRASIDGFVQVPANRLAAARSLGASRWRAFWRVEWPVALPWLLPNLCLVFLYCFSSFGLALLLGGMQYATIEVEIYTLVAYQLNLVDAGELALVSLLLACGLVAVYIWLESKLVVPVRFDPLLPSSARTWVDRAWLTAALFILLIFEGFPLLAVLCKSLLALDGLTAVWDEELQRALFNSARFTLLTVLFSGLLGLLHALGVGRRLWLRSLVFLPFVVSPICVAFGLLLLYPSWSAHLAMLLAAYILLGYPFVVKAVGTALDSMPEHLAQAASSLGASSWRVFQRVTWPLLQPAFRRGLAFAAATSVGEFSVTLFLSRPEWLTLTTLIYHKLGRPGQANADATMLLSGLLMVLSVLVFAMIENGTSCLVDKGKGAGHA